MKTASLHRTNPFPLSRKSRARARRLRLGKTHAARGLLPLRLTPALSRSLAALCCLWLASTQGAILAARAEATRIAVREGVSLGATMNLNAGKSLSIPLPAGAEYSVTGAGDLVKIEKIGSGENAALSIWALRPGRAVLTMEIPNKHAQTYIFKIAGDGVEPEAVAPAASTPVAAPSEPLLGATSLAAGTDFAALESTSRAAQNGLETQREILAALQITRPEATQVTTPQIQVVKPQIAPQQFSLSTQTKTRMARATAAQTAPRASIISSSNGLTLSHLALENRGVALTPRITMSALAQVAPPLPELQLMPRTAPKTATRVPSSGIASPATLAASPSAVAPRTAANASTSVPMPGVSPIPSASTAPIGMESADNSSTDVTATSDVPPPRVPEGSAAFPSESPLPNEIARLANDPTARRPLYRVTSGMARILAFRANILAVFFSDENTMDARAINARTLAVTGKGAGRSTLAVFLSRYPGDVVGRAAIYNIEVFPASGRSIVAAYSDPTTAEAAIRTALNDPRVRVSVIQKPDGTLVAQLAGALRDVAEVNASIATASLFVPNVNSSLYANPTAPTLDEALAGPSLVGAPLLQSQLRSILGNDSIELIALPGGTAIKATVDTAGEAENILAMLPLLGRQMQPLITLRGVTGNRFYSSERPILYGEDFEITRRMNEVTGISTVYAVRTARNAIALYGTVRNRAEYDTIRRYANLLPQLQEAAASTQQTNTQSAGGATLSAPATTATTTSVAAIAPALSAAQGLAPAPSTSGLSGLTESNAPSGAYKFPIQVQMFVRILDDADSSVRLVTIESTIAEVSRTAMKNLGAQFGSTTLISRTTTAGTPATTTSGPLGTTASSGTPSVTTSTVDNTFNSGQGLFGDFAGSGGVSNINPLRIRLNALLQNGAARILSKPNLTAVEGTSAQITIGGVRPVPQVTANGAAGGTQQTNIVFRRFGIILSMRPTVTDDDTIILQIRGDVTNLDPSIAININGAIIPGESVRSVDTTVTMREGDTLVIGGLITNEYRKQTTKVPILGDLPIIGSLFRSKSFENNETELAIFLTPRMLRQHISSNGHNDVLMAPSFPPLPSLQDDQQSPLGLSNAGTNVSNSGG